MPFDVWLEPEKDPAVRRRAAERNAALRAQLASIPPRTIDETLLLAP